MLLWPKIQADIVVIVVIVVIKFMFLESVSDCKSDCKKHFLVEAVVDHSLHLTDPSYGNVDCDLGHL